MGAENQLVPPQELSNENAVPHDGQTTPAKRQRRWLQYSLGAILLVVLLAAIVFGVMVETKRRALLRRIDDAIEKTNGAENLSRASACYRQLFALVGEGGLARLKASEADSIAVQAAWEEVKRTVPDSEDAPVFRPEKEKLALFVQFLESRLSTKTPTWWAEVVQDAKWFGRDFVQPGDPTESPYHKSGLLAVESPRGVTLQAESKTITLTSGNDVIEVPTSFATFFGYRLTHWAGGTFHNLSAAFTKGRCFLTLHDDIGYAPRVACIDRVSGKVLWEAHACGCFWDTIARMDFRNAWVSVVTHDDRVILYGKSFQGVYVHAFHRNDGKTLFRFSSSF